MARSRGASNHDTMPDLDDEAVAGLGDAKVYRDEAGDGVGEGPGTETIVKETVEYAYMLRANIFKVQTALVYDKHGGVEAMYALLCVLKGDLQDEYEKVITEFEDAISGETYKPQYVGERKLPWTTATKPMWENPDSKRAKMRVWVGRTLRQLVRSIDARGLLVKGRTEPVGGEM